MMLAQTTVDAPKYGASSREAEISVASAAPPTRKATVPSLAAPTAESATGASAAAAAGRSAKRVTSAV